MADFEIRVFFLTSLRYLRWLPWMNQLVHCWITFQILWWLVYSFVISLIIINFQWDISLLHWSLIGIFIYNKYWYRYLHKFVLFFMSNSYWLATGLPKTVFASLWVKRHIRSNVGLIIHFFILNIPINDHI